MGIFQKISDWLTEKSDRFIRGEAQDEFEPEQEQEEPEAEVTMREPLDPFGRGEGEYGGRVPYRSKADLERGLYALLAREYGIPQKNATILLRFDAQGELVGVSVYLSGTALMQNPDTLARELSQKLGCTVEVR